MISELNLIWQLEDLIDEQIELASKTLNDELAAQYLEKVDFLKDQIEIIKMQPRWDKWNLATESEPLIDGRYFVYQKYLKDGYKEVTTAVWKKGKWVLDTGEYNHKFSSYTLRRVILAWGPLPSPPLFEALEVEQMLIERKEENEQVLM